MAPPHKHYEQCCEQILQMGLPMRTHDRRKHDIRHISQLSSLKSTCINVFTIIRTDTYSTGREEENNGGAVDSTASNMAIFVQMP